MRFYHLMKCLLVVACVTLMATTTVHADEYDQELENIESSFDGTPLVVSHAVDVSSSKLSAKISAASSPSLSASVSDGSDSSSLSLLETTSSRSSSHDGMTRGGAADALRLAAARARRTSQQRTHRHKYGSQHGRALRRRQTYTQTHARSRSRSHPQLHTLPSHRQYARHARHAASSHPQAHGFLELTTEPAVTASGRPMKSRRGRTQSLSAFKREQKEKERAARRKELGLRSLFRRKNNPFPHQESFYGLWDPVKDQYRHGVDESEYVPGLFADRTRHVAALRPAGMTRAPFCATFPFCKFTPPPPPIHGLPVEPAAPAPGF